MKTTFETILLKKIYECDQARDYETGIEFLRELVRERNANWDRVKDRADILEAQRICDQWTDNYGASDESLRRMMEFWRDAVSAAMEKAERENFG